MRDDGFVAIRIIFAERNHALGRLRFHYYGKLLVEKLSGPHKPVELGTPDWRDLMESHSLFLMPVPEEYLDVDGAEFLARVIALYKDQ